MSSIFQYFAFVSHKVLGLFRGIQKVNYSYVARFCGEFFRIEFALICLIFKLIICMDWFISRFLKEITTYECLLIIFIEF